MSIKHVIAVAATAFVLAACSASNVQLQHEYNPSGYDYANFALYHAGRDTKVDIYGDPFGMNSAAFAKAVTDHMQGANPGRPTHFTTTPGPSAEKNMRVVMAFNADTAAYDLCNARDISAGPRSNGLALKAAWCFGNRQDSSVEARIGGADGTSDPRFRALVRQAVLNLFPQHMDRELIRDNGGDRERPN